MTRRPRAGREATRLAALLVVAAVSVGTLAPSARSQVTPPAEYTLVELAGAEPGAAGAVAAERAVLRVGGYVHDGTYVDASSGATCDLARPAIWDVDGPSSPVAPQLLPSPVPGKPARVIALSPDGTWLGGVAWGEDDGSLGIGGTGCSYAMAPAVWGPDGAGGWRAILLPVPPGHDRGMVTGITDGGTVVFGSAAWPVRAADGTTDYAGRAVVWRRAADGSFHAEVLPSCETCEAYWTRGLRADGAVGTGRVTLDRDDVAAPWVPAYWEDDGGGWTMHVLSPLVEGAYASASPAPGGGFVGQAELAPNVHHAVVWESSIAAPFDLGSGDQPEGKSWAARQNAGGAIVGGVTVAGRGTSTEERAARWTPPEWAFTDLNTTADTNGWTLRSALDVDEAGRIVGAMDREVSRELVRGWFALIPVQR